MKPVNKPSKLSRRQFIKGAAASAAAFTIVPRHVLGGPNNTPPSEKLNIAAIGAGGRGGGDINACKSENIVALCDVDFRKAAGTFKAYPDATKYRDFRKMLEKEEKNIDAVIVATPDHCHAVAAMMAVKMGKHCYCEKPLTHDIAEARALRLAAREHKVATQMGNQGHAGEGARLVCEWVWDGAIGDVTEVHSWTNRPVWPQNIARPQGSSPVPDHLDWDLWLGPAPHRPYVEADGRCPYLPFVWRGWWDFGTGALGDMACHVWDAAFWSLKLSEVYPTSVDASKVGGNDETFPLASIVQFRFPARGNMPPLTYTWHDGGLMPPRPACLEPGRSWKPGGSGSLFVGSKGSLICGEYGESPRIIPEAKMQAYLKTKPKKSLPRSPGHHQEWIDACKGGKPAGSNWDYAGPLTEMVLLGNLAIRTGEQILWDGKNMKVTNNVKGAQEMVQRQYRNGWSL